MTPSAGPAPSRQRPFVALVEAMKAVTQGDGDRLSAVLRSTDLDGLLRMAGRHRCAGALLRGIGALGVEDPSGGALIKGLQTSVKAAALQSFAVRIQLNAVLEAFRGTGVPCVLLKGAARLHTREDDADWTPIFDLDLLIRERDIGGAIAALKTMGYRANESGGSEAWYRAHHHHLVPFDPPGPGLPIEIHLVLGWPGAIAQRFDWERIAPYLQPLDGAAMVYRLDQTGTALHRAIHAMDMTRLHDVVLLARCLQRGGDATLEALERMWRAEHRQRVAIQAVVILAAALTGRTLDAPPEVRRYLRWVTQREELPRQVRLRTGLADAWFINGGHLFGPASRLALPPCGTGGYRVTATELLRWPVRLAGLIAMGTWGLIRAGAEHGRDVM